VAGEITFGQLTQRDPSELAAEEESGEESSSEYEADSEESSSEEVTASATARFCEFATRMVRDGCRCCDDGELGLEEHGRTCEPLP